MGSAEAKLDDQYKQATMAEPYLGRTSLCKAVAAPLPVSVRAVRNRHLLVESRARRWRRVPDRMAALPDAAMPKLNRQWDGHRVRGSK